MGAQEIKLPTWVVALLITVLLAACGTIFTAGATYNTVQSVKERVDRLEERFDERFDSQSRGSKK